MQFDCLMSDQFWKNDSAYLENSKLIGLNNMSMYGTSMYIPIIDHSMYIPRIAHSIDSLVHVNTKSSI